MSCRALSPRGLRSRLVGRMEIRQHTGYRCGMKIANLRRSLICLVLVLANAAVFSGCDPPPPVTQMATSGGPPPPPPAQAATTDPAASALQVQNDVRRCVTALFAGDYETLLSLSHPKLLAAGGGR